LSSKLTRILRWWLKFDWFEYLEGYRIRELRPTAHAVVTALTAISAAFKALMPSWIEEPVVIRSSIKITSPCGMSEFLTK